MKSIQKVKILFYIVLFLVFALYFIKAECSTGEIDYSNDKYCDIDGVWKSLKPDNSACQNDYECEIGSCKNGICQEFDVIKTAGQQQSLIQGIIDYFYPASTGSSGSSGSGTPSACGNNDRERGEVCDGTDLMGKNCFILGFSGGTLKCSTNCTAWNTNSCFVSTPQAPQQTCIPICSSICGGESSGCGTTCIYNDGAYCAENSVCESGNCVEKLGCNLNSDCLENEVCENNKCMPQKKSNFTSVLILILIILIVVAGIIFIVIKKKKTKKIIIEDKAKKPEEKKNYY